MPTEKIKGRIIQAGYPWSLRLVFDEGYDFPASARFISHVRRDPSVNDVLATMSSENGGILRINNSTLDLRLTAAQTEGWPDRKVWLDVIRIDLPQHEHLGFQITVPVRQAITRGYQ